MRNTEIAPSWRLNIVGATLAYCPARYDVYGEAYLDDPAIRAVADKVRFEINEEIERKYYPRRFATGVTIRFADGSTRSCIVADSVGTPRKPMSREQIIAKADGLASQGRFLSGDELATAIWEGKDALALAHALTAGI
ncbi:MmgE/PrpD family protein (plasmid) [Burkholderia sp. YI23]|nr:MmgE/PrpD family protein [Burkholderia sp. YI23]